MSWNGAWSSLLRSLTLPQTAGPGDPRIVLGPLIPSTLVVPGFTFYAAIVYYFNATDYKFEAVGTQGANRVWMEGTYDTTHGVVMTWYEFAPSAIRDPLFVFGGPFNAAPMEYQLSNATLAISEANVTFPTGRELAYGNDRIGYDTAGFVSTGGAETAIAAAAWVLEPQFLAVTGRVYRVHWRAQVGASAGGGMYGTVRVRIGSATVVGTAIATTYVDAPTNAWSPTREGWGYAVCTGAGGVTTLSLTIQKNAGAAGNILIDSDGFSPILVEVDDMGDIAVNDQYSPLAVAF